jgi:sec-independent protein translocase protein TatB
MFDFGFGYTELVVVAIVAIIVIGPKDLPRVLRAIGRMTAKVRGMAREFQGHLDAAMRETGMDEMKRDLQSLKTSNPLTEVSKDLRKQDDDFKKYFGELNGKTTEQLPAKSSETAVAAKTSGNDFDLYFGKPKTDQAPS